MVKFSFQELGFKEEKDRIKVYFLKYFYFYISKKDLEGIGKFKISKNSIEFDCSEKKASKFNFLLEKGFNSLKNFKDKPSTYIHKNSGIPLIGTGYFGIIDRGTNLIEIKPITGCNLNCIYCSVDENKRVREFIVEKDYLIEELKNLIREKKEKLEIHIGAQGETLLYAPIIDLIGDIGKIINVKKISLETNGVLLTKELADKLIEAGLNQFNLSLNSLNEDTAKNMANCRYPLKKVREVAEYISKKANLVIAPVLIEGINEKDMDDIIKFCKRVNAKVGIQNYLNYRFGRNIKKQMSWEKFFSILKSLEEKHSMKLIFSKNDFDIKKDNSLEKPFKKGDVIEAEILLEGRFRNEMLAVAKNRVISVINCNKKGKQKIKIIRSKHNIFVGKLA